MSNTSEDEYASEFALMQLADRVKKLARDLPGIRLGWTGDIQGTEDRRVWTVLLPHTGREAILSLDAVYLAYTNQLPDAFDCWDQTIGIIRHRYHQDAERRGAMRTLAPTLVKRTNLPATELYPVGR